MEFLNDATDGRCFEIILNGYLTETQTYKKTQLMVLMVLMILYFTRNILLAWKFIILNVLLRLIIIIKSTDLNIKSIL